MKRADLTTTEKRRLEQNRICPLCGQRIEDDDRILFTTRRESRCKLYTFYHERCLIYGKKEEKNEKLTTKIK